MTKYKYEVYFDHDSKKFIVAGGESTLSSEDLDVLKIYGDDAQEKSRAYGHMAKLRTEEKARRKLAYK